MGCEPVLADGNAVGEAALHHKPAKGALRRAENKKCRKFAGPALRYASPNEEKHEWNEKNEADKPAEQPVGPLPPIDGLERIQAHARIYELILRYLLMFIERF